MNPDHLPGRPRLGLASMTIEVHGAGRRLQVGTATEIGRRYPANFDVLHTAELQRRPGLCAVVADGMGAGEGSRTAGRTAVDIFTTAVQEHRGPFRRRRCSPRSPTRSGRSAPPARRCGS